MFLGLDRPVEYGVPWAVPPATRRSWLRSGDLRIAYIYENEDSSTFRYRIFNMVEALRAGAGRTVAASWFTRMDFQTDQSFVDDCDVLVVCRTRYDATVGRLLERAHSRDVLVVFDVDDLIVDPRYVHYVMDALAVPTSDERNWDYWFAYVGRLRATLDLCHASIATTETLAGHIRDVTGKACATLPNFLNRRQTEVSSVLTEHKQARRYERNDEVTVGFLSGSPTHQRDFEVALPALAAAMDRHRSMRLQIVGHINPCSALDRHSDRVEFLPLQDFLNLQRLVARCEFCIVPLALNEFSNCKSELKFFEAGIVDCPIVASPIPAYADAISEGVDGFLAFSHEWHERIEQTFRLAEGGQDSYLEVARAARHTSLTRYAWDQQADRIVDTIAGLQSERPHRATGR